MSKLRRRDTLPAAPRAARKPHELRCHGHKRIDPYFWLNQRENPAVIDYLESENAYTDRVFAAVSPSVADLADEMRARIPEEEQSAPYRDGDYVYYYRYDKGREHPVYCRRSVADGAREQVLLDVNQLAGDHVYFNVRHFCVSPDHRRAAFAVDTEGRRFFTLRFLDLESGQLLGDRIDDVTSDFEWANDSRTVFYVRQDRKTLREYQVLRHRLGEIGDPLVFEEADETFWVTVERSLSGRYLYVVSAATLTTEVRYLPADEPTSVPRIFARRRAGHEYYVTDGEDGFFVLSNAGGAQNFRVLTAALRNTDERAWREWIAHRDDVLIDGMEVFHSHVVLSTVVNANDRIEVVWRDDGRRSCIQFDEEAHTVYTDDNHRYRTSELRFCFESLTTPPSVFDLDLVSGERRLIKRDEVRGDFDVARYRSERLWVKARDGTSVPVSLVYRRGLVGDGSHPLLLEAYGAYGLNSDPEFDAELLSLLDRGFVYAIAHVRGGAEMGRQWYENGRLENKVNTFFDFIDVTRFLISEGYTAADRCYATGGSAGGLLIGAVANMAPDLYHGMATRVPFVDVVTTMLDDSIPLTTGEFDEWGNPAEPAAYERMLGYSPYDNVGTQAYPHLLVTTGLHDSQVQYWEPVKWVAKLRAEKSNDNLVLLRVDMQAGHSGKSGRFRSLEDSALVYAFFLYLEGLRNAPRAA